MANNATQAARTSTYARFDPRVWDDERFIVWDDTKRVVWMLLLTRPNFGPIPGLLLCGAGTLGEILRRPVGTHSDSFLHAAAEHLETVAGTVPPTVAETVPPTVSDTVPQTVAGTVGDTVSETVPGTVRTMCQVLEELVLEGRIEVDVSRRMIRLPRAVLYDRPANPNMLISWFRYWKKLPPSPLKYKHAVSIGCVCTEASVTMQKTFASTFLGDPDEAAIVVKYEKFMDSEPLGERLRERFRERLRERYAQHTLTLTLTKASGEPLGAAPKKSAGVRACGRSGHTGGGPPDPHSHTDFSTADSTIHDNSTLQADHASESKTQDANPSSSGINKHGITAAQFKQLAWDTFLALRSKHYDNDYTIEDGDKRAMAKVLGRMRVDLHKAVEAGRLSINDIDSGASIWLTYFWSHYFAKSGSGGSLRDRGHPVRFAEQELNGLAAPPEFREK